MTAGGPGAISAAIWPSSDTPSLWQSSGEAPKPLFRRGQFTRHDIEEIEHERCENQRIPQVIGGTVPISTYLE
jgi:hypothetical protein